MNIDPKLSQFRSFLSENRLNNGGVKTTINQSAVFAGENANSDLNLKSEDDSQKDKDAFYKSKKNKIKSQSHKNLADQDLTKKNPTDEKPSILRLLNLI